MEFRCRLASPTGEIVEGIYTSENETRLRHELEEKGLYVLSLQRPDWQVDVDDIKDKAVATRKRILDMVATEKIWAVGHHMPFPSVGFVERTGESCRWVPASYQLNL